MSLSNLRNAINSLKSNTRSLGNRPLDYNWKQRFIRMLDELERTLKDMDEHIGDIESKIE